MKKFSWTIDGRMYFLTPTYKMSPGGRVWISGCEMYDKDADYIGYWYRENMPVNLIHAMARHVKVVLASEPREEVAVKSYRRRVGKR